LQRLFSECHPGEIFGSKRLVSVGDDIISAARVLIWTGGSGRSNDSPVMKGEVSWYGSSTGLVLGGLSAMHVMGICGGVT